MTANKTFAGHAAAHTGLRMTRAMKAHERGPAAARRRNMIERLGAGGICDPRVLEAMAAIPRHIFVDPALADRAYDDYAAPIGEGQTISKPYTVAMMTQLAGLTGTERALEVGTGSGYQTSVLSLLAGSVVTVERLKSLSNRARKIFNELHLTNIVCLVGDGSVGAAKYAPFDVIIVTAGAPEIPEPLARQLVDGGRMIVPVGKGGEQKIALVRRSGERFKVEMKEGCKFVPLLGESGFKQKPARG